MVRRYFSRGFLVACTMAALIAAGTSQAQDNAKRGRKYKAPPPTAHVEVTVVRASSGKPVENASVIFHPIENGHDAGTMELKTNDEGKTTIDLLELGSNVRVQVIAPGFQTFGEDYKVDKDKMTIAVVLNRPSGQYSIYKKGEGKAATGDKPKDGSGDGSKDSAKPQEPSTPK